MDSIEANVESSAVHVEEGADQLRQAERYQVVIVVVLNRFSYLNRFKPVWWRLYVIEVHSMF